MLLSILCIIFAFFGGFFLAIGVNSNQTPLASSDVALKQQFSLTSLILFIFLPKVPQLSEEKNFTP